MVLPSLYLLFLRGVFVLRLPEDSQRPYMLLLCLFFIFARIVMSKLAHRPATKVHLMLDTRLNLKNSLRYNMIDSLHKFNKESKKRRF